MATRTLEIKEEEALRALLSLQALPTGETSSGLKGPQSSVDVSWPKIESIAVPVRMASWESDSPSGLDGEAPCGAQDPGSWEDDEDCHSASDGSTASDLDSSKKRQNDEFDSVSKRSRHHRDDDGVAASTDFKVVVLFNRCSHKLFNYGTISFSFPINLLAN